MQEVNILIRQGRAGSTIKNYKALSPRGAIKSAIGAILVALENRTHVDRYISMELRKADTNDLFFEATVSGHNLTEEDRDKIAEAADDLIEKKRIAAILTERMKTAILCERDWVEDWRGEDYDPLSEQALGAIRSKFSVLVEIWEAVIGSTIAVPTKEELFGDHTRRG